MPVNRIEGGPSSAQRRSFEAERRANAQIIMRVGYAMGASDRDVMIALMTAMQESSLRNLNYGDRDSLGLFQQRAGWGSRAQRMDPNYSARKFFESLLRIKNRDSLAPTVAAQKVQRSAYPNAYAKHQGYAEGLMRSLGRNISDRAMAARGASGAQLPGSSPAKRLKGAVASPVGLTANASTAAAPIPDWESPAGVADISSAATSQVVNTADKPVEMSQWTLNELDKDAFEAAFRTGAPGSSGNRAMDIINFARGFIGTPYVWGGTSPLGFDCSGLIQYAFKQFGVNLPRVSFQQANAGTRVDAGSAQAGDLWWIDNSSRNNGADHIALYIGDGQILEAPRTGLNIRIRQLSQNELTRGGFTRVL